MPQSLTPVDVRETAAPGNPVSGFRRLFPKADGTWWTRDSAGTETQLGAGGGGGFTAADSSTAFALTFARQTF